MRISLHRWPRRSHALPIATVGAETKLWLWIERTLANNNHTLYAQLITIEYGYKFSESTATLIVEPPKTDVTAQKPASGSVTQTTDGKTVTIPPQKTPEQTQQQAVQLGALALGSIFRWRYPWYLLNATITIGNLVIQVLFNPILTGGEELIIKGVDIFSQITEEIWQDIILDLLGIFLSYAFAKGLSMWNLAAGMLTEVIKGGVQYGLFFKEFVVEMAGSMKMLAIAVANIIMGLVAIGTKIGEAFVKTLFNRLFAPAYAVVVSTAKTMISYAAPLNIVRTPVDYFESLAVDFPIAILALLRFLGRI